MTSAKELVEYGAAHATGDYEHMVKAQSLYHDAQKSLALASGEWDRLRREYKKSEKEKHILPKCIC
jgi:hypothetical protein